VKGDLNRGEAKIIIWPPSGKENKIVVLKKEKVEFFQKNLVVSNSLFSFKKCTHVF